MDLVVEYVESIQKIDEIEDSGLDSNSKVGKSNKLANRIRKIAAEIESKHPDMKYAFYQLLFHEKATVRIWAAHHILEIMNYDNECKREALKEIAYIAEHGSGINRLGNEMWLTSWFQEHPEDKHLL